MAILPSFSRLFAQVQTAPPCWPNYLQLFSPQQVWSCNVSKLLKDVQHGMQATCSNSAGHGVTASVCPPTPTLTDKLVCYSPGCKYYIVMLTGIASVEVVQWSSEVSECVQPQLAPLYASTSFRHMTSD